MGFFNIFKEKINKAQSDMLNKSIEAADRLQEKFNKMNTEAKKRVENTNPFFSEPQTNKDLGEQITVQVIPQNKVKQSPDKNIKLCTPSKNGLFPQEILMLSYADTFFNCNNTFQNFWEYRYGVDNPQKLLDNLKQKGFVEIADLKNTLKNQTLAILKDELKNSGLKVSGNKDSLIERLLTEGNIYELEQKFNHRKYMLTEKGKQELDNNEYVRYIHRKQFDEIGLNIYTLNQLMVQNNSDNYMQVIIDFLIEKSKEEYNKGRFSRYGNFYYKIADLYIEYSKYEDALTSLAISAYSSLSGVPNNFSPEFEKIAHESFLEAISVTRVYGIVNWRKVIANLQIENNQLFDILVEIFSGISILHLYFTDIECAKIIIAEIENDQETLDKIYNCAEQRYKEKFFV